MAFFSVLNIPAVMQLRYLQTPCRAEFDHPLPDAGRRVSQFLDLLDKAEKPFGSNRATRAPLMKDASLGARGKELA